MPLKNVWQIVKFGIFEKMQRKINPMPLINDFYESHIIITTKQDGAEARKGESKIQRAGYYEANYFGEQNGTTKP